MVASPYPVPRNRTTFDVGISTDVASNGSISYVTLDLKIDHFAVLPEKICASLSVDEAELLSDRLKKMAALLREEKK